MSLPKSDSKSTPHKVTRQRRLFAPEVGLTDPTAGPDEPCEVVAIEKRRDGGTRYWCRTHRADATAKGGVPSPKCRAADAVPLHEADIKTLNLDKYKGGVALWGAAPAVYDTTHLPMERGIHVHARPKPDSEKEIDLTFRALRIAGNALPDDGIVVNDVDALYYMVSSVFGFSMNFVTCTYCGWPHLDKDWFSVYPHRKHLCAGCGRHFHDRVTSIGNPIIGVRDACRAATHRVVPAPKSLAIRQSDYPGGIQIWGSNPAFLWTQHKDEEEGIHVHAFRGDEQTEPTIDDTFHDVTIDNIRLDARMVRLLMAQNVMPSLRGRIVSLNCKRCERPQFDTGEAAFTPSHLHSCRTCGFQASAPGRKRNVVANPLPAILVELAKLAPRPPQLHQLHLPAETL